MLEMLERRLKKQHMIKLIDIWYLLSQSPSTDNNPLQKMCASFLGLLKQQLLLFSVKHCLSHSPLVHLPVELLHPLHQVQCVLGACPWQPPAEISKLRVQDDLNFTNWPGHVTKQTHVWTKFAYSKITICATIVLWTLVMSSTMEIWTYLHVGLTLKIQDILTHMFMYCVLLHLHLHLRQGLMSRDKQLSEVLSIMELWLSTILRKKHSIQGPTLASKSCINTYSFFFFGICNHSYHHKHLYTCSVWWKRQIKFSPHLAACLEWKSQKRSDNFLYQEREGHTWFCHGA